MIQLSRSEMKHIVGGNEYGSSFPGGCCVHTTTWNGYQCGLTYNQVQNLWDGGNGGWDHWCCDSCESSWNASH